MSKAIIVLSDGSTYDLPENSELIILTDKGVNTLEECNDVSCLQLSDIESVYSLDDVLYETLNRHNL